MYEREMPAHFGGALWVDHTVVHPLGLIALACAVLAVLLLPRRHALIPLVLIAVAIPGAQRIVLASLDFSFIRIVILTILLAATLRGHWRGLRLGTPDLLIICWMLWGILAYALLKGGFDGVITATGGAINTIGAYFIGRIYIRSTQDIRRLFILLSIISVPMLLFFMIERITGHNMFSVFGGVPEETMIRNGRLRVQGPFSHPIMAGVFWASLLPCIGAMWMGAARYRGKMLVPMLCMLFIVINTASSTPVMAVLLGMFGMALYVFRFQLRYLVGGTALLLLALHMVMKQPVWHLLSRIDLANGSTGWHRYNLIQQAINHFNEWWLYGVESTAHWGWGLQDITNQFVFEGVNGGILQLLLFVAFLTSVFLGLGRSLRSRPSRAESWLFWGLGVSLFVHCMSFLAVSYFGQMVCLFYLFIGGTVGVTAAARRPGKSRVAVALRPAPQANTAS